MFGPTDGSSYVLLIKDAKPLIGHKAWEFVVIYSCFIHGKVQMAAFQRLVEG